MVQGVHVATGCRSHRDKASYRCEADISRLVRMFNTMTSNNSSSRGRINNGTLNNNNNSVELLEKSNQSPSGKNGQTDTLITYNRNLAVRKNGGSKMSQLFNKGLSRNATGLWDINVLGGNDVQWPAALEYLKVKGVLPNVNELFRKNFFERESLCYNQSIITTEIRKQRMGLACSVVYCK